MATLYWFLRCIPGISTLLLLLLLESSLGVLRSGYAFYYHGRHTESSLATPIGLQILFSVYTLFLHFIAFTFPLRVALAARNAAKAIRHQHSRDGRPPKQGDRTVTMVVVIPAYKESLDTMRETLDVLASHQDAGETYDIFLAMEERDANAQTSAATLISEYEHRFLDMQSTLHPAGIPGESAGKSSNVSWAVQEVMAKYNGRGDVLVTVMDSDSHLMQQYFQYVRERHMSRQEHPYSSFVLYVPPIIFDRNAHNVPRLVRVADLLWSGAGLSCFAMASASDHLAIPTAVYTVSLPLVQHVNGWDAGPDAIGEDMHMMLKCYFATKGLLRIESVPSPASMCNISVSKRGIRGWAEHHNARYTQALRHMWGCLDSGYAVRQWLSMDCTSPPVSRTCSPSSSPHPPRLRKPSQSIRAPRWEVVEPRRFTFRNTTLFLRLFEAHFLPAHIPIILLASAVFTSLPPLIKQWPYLNWALDATGWLRAGGFLFMMVYFIVAYEDYHDTCVNAREREMEQAGLLDTVSFSRRQRWSLGSVADYICFPIAGTIYGALPLLQAAITHFWTMELVYLVSAKPVRNIGKTLAKTTPCNGDANLEELVPASNRRIHQEQV